MLIYRGHLADQLVKYQVLISQFATNYNFAAWYAYDKAFRTFISNNPHARLDGIVQMSLCITNF